MIENIISYIDKKHPELKGLGYCTLQELNDIFTPVKKAGKEYKQIENFDKLQEFSYWRVIENINIELDPVFVNKTYKLTYPCKLMLCKKSETSDDTLALSVINSLTPFTKLERKEMGVHNFSFDFKGYDINQKSVKDNEFGVNFKMSDSFVLLAFNIDLIITVDASCIDIC